jgi:hypothetical protein
MSDAKTAIAAMILIAVVVGSALQHVASILTRPRLDAPSADQSGVPYADRTCASCDAGHVH